MNLPMLTLPAKEEPFTSPANIEGYGMVAVGMLREGTQPMQDSTTLQRGGSEGTLHMSSKTADC